MFDCGYVSWGESKGKGILEKNWHKDLGIFDSQKMASNSINLSKEQVDKYANI